VPESVAVEEDVKGFDRFRQTVVREAYAGDQEVLGYHALECLPERAFPRRHFEVSGVARVAAGLEPKQG
jgi:hypothetical protein